MSHLAALFATPEILALSKLVLAIIAGSVIGFERYQSGHPAGQRTFAIICLTSALLTISLAPGDFTELMNQPGAGGSRIIQCILQGIGFIGAGVIVRDGLTTKGLTSAASVWLVSAIGILIGTSEYFLAISGTVLTTLILLTFKKIYPFRTRRSFAVVEAVFAKDAFPTEDAILSRLKCYGFNVTRIAFKGVKTNEMQIKADVWVDKDAAQARAQLALDFLKDPEIEDFSIEQIGE